MSAVWDLARIKDQTYPQLRSRVEVDVAVIGAGITGLATALKLVQAGERVAVVEAHRVGGGTTAGSTGNLYATLSNGLSPVRSKWSQAIVDEVVALRGQALDFVEKTVNDFSIDCDFARRPLHFCISAPDQKLEKLLDAEHQAASEAGLPATIVDSVEGLKSPLYRALRIEGQAQFNPLAFIQGLAEAVTEEGGLIFEASGVRDLDASEGLVRTEHGEIHASSIVQATHTPKGINLLQAEMEPYREYGVALPVTDLPLAPGIYWMLDDSESLRIYSHGGQAYLVVVGQKHKTGQGSEGRGYYDSLRAYARDRFNATEAAFEWSAQQYRSADLLPYIGRSGHDNVYVATGFAADGLTWGCVAAGIISNQILGRESRGAQLLDPRRFTPVKSAGNWAKENVSVASHLVRDYLTPEEEIDLQDLAPGEGRVVKVQGEKLAVYRAADRSFSALSPVCPHMKCHVHWNSADATWDCPCHGSRFATDGQVLEGPAYEPLAPRDLP